MRELSERMKQINKLIGSSSKIEITVLTPLFEADPEKQEAMDYFRKSDEVTFSMEPINQIQSKITIEVKNDGGLCVCSQCSHCRYKDDGELCDITGEPLSDDKEYCENFKQDGGWEHLKRKDKNDNKEYETG